MRILHYTVGLPSNWDGGLPKYSYDLSFEQMNQGNEVSILYPGEYNLYSKTKVVFDRFIESIKVYKVLNPQLVTTAGVNSPCDFYKKCNNKGTYYDFLASIKPDIIHIHSLMGLHKELIEASKFYGIKTVFTTHDYFGICPKINLFDYKNEVCKDYNNGKKCCICNNSSESSRIIRLKKSTFCKTIKKNKYIFNFYKYIRKNKSLSYHNKDILCVDKNLAIDNIKKSKEYVKLRQYYLDILRLIDYIHFNSNVARQEYEKYIKVDGKTINISHSDIRDRRIKKVFNCQSKLKISYLGPTADYKGFFLLKKIADDLFTKGIDNWSINIYGNNSNDFTNINPNICLNGVYSYDSLEKIFNNTDLLVIPSKCRETFGFVGLEALSFGVPIMVTNNVGMKDIITNNVTGIIVNPNPVDIGRIITDLIYDRTLLCKINENILKMDFKYIMNKHTIEILNLYKSILKNKLL
ncbi:glycosyltransferase [Clostridium guangxiense]|uniref:glycosyltransferase n=1 Tax=Clostridium guangxiense TaxID=1662055 RepID=UPI001E38B3A8|nr:glycosyltransferase [Clostridium guangxiense]MCD2346253.1 glycosyltransferase [Clostridium guangxiense]